MRLPWVGRLAYESMEQRAIRAERLCDTLTDRLVSLKMAGAVEVPAVVEAPHGTVPTPAPDELRELIDAKAGTDLRRRKMMLRQLAADRAAGVSPDDIREAIEHGIVGDGVPG